MHACTAYIRRTRAVVQAKHSVTHTKSYQVIHQLIGTNNVQILGETARAEKAEPAPAPQLYHSARPSPHILPYPGPRPAPPRGYQPTGARSPARTALVWPAARTAPQQITNTARGGPPRAGPLYVCTYVFAYVCICVCIDVCFLRMFYVNIFGVCMYVCA